MHSAHHIKQFHKVTNKQSLLYEIRPLAQKIRDGLILLRLGWYKMQSDQMKNVQKFLDVFLHITRFDDAGSAVLI